MFRLGFKVADLQHFALRHRIHARVTLRRARLFNLDRDLGGMDFGYRHCVNMKRNFPGILGGKCHSFRESYPFLNASHIGA